MLDPSKENVTVRRLRRSLRWRSLGLPLLFAYGCFLYAESTHAKGISPGWYFLIGMAFGLSYGPFISTSKRNMVRILRATNFILWLGLLLYAAEIYSHALAFSVFLVQMSFAFLNWKRLHSYLEHYERFGDEAVALDLIDEAAESPKSPARSSTKAEARRTLNLSFQNILSRFKEWWRRKNLSV